MSDSPIKAIETVHSGYRFRSRLEACYAVFFEALGVQYEYEKEGYDLGKDGWYPPDFWLPELKMWFEVKGDTPTAEEVSKAKNLFEQSTFPTLLCSGTPGQQRLLLACYDSTDGSAGFNWWEDCYWCLSDKNGDFCLCTGDANRHRAYMTSDWRPAPRILNSFECRRDDSIDRALALARQARFEHRGKHRGKDGGSD